MIEFWKLVQSTRKSFLFSKHPLQVEFRSSVQILRKLLVCIEGVDSAVFALWSLALITVRLSVQQEVIVDVYARSEVAGLHEQAAPCFQSTVRNNEFIASAYGRQLYTQIQIKKKTSDFPFFLESTSTEGYIRWLHRHSLYHYCLLFVSPSPTLKLTLSSFFFLTDTKTHSQSNPICSTHRYRTLFDVSATIWYSNSLN